MSGDLKKVNGNPPQRFISTFVLQIGRRWTVVCNGTPEMGPSADPAEAMRVYRRMASDAVEADVPVWDGEADTFTTWAATAGLRT